MAHKGSEMTMCGDCSHQQQPEVWHILGRSSVPTSLPGILGSQTHTGGKTEKWVCLYRENSGLVLIFVSGQGTK